MTISKSHAGLAICGFLMFAVVISGDAWLARGKLCWFVELHGRLVCVLDVHLLTCSETYLLQYFFWQSVARCRSFVVVSRWCVMVTYASSVSWCFDVICNPPGRSMIQRHPIHIYIYICTLYSWEVPLLTPAFIQNNIPSLRISGIQKGPCSCHPPMPEPVSKYSYHVSWRFTDGPPVSNWSPLLFSFGPRTTTSKQQAPEDQRTGAWIALAIIPSIYLLKNPPQLRNSMSEPKTRLILNYRPLKPLLNYQHGRFLCRFRIKFQKTTLTAHFCPPCLSTMTRRVYTSRLSFPQWHGLTQTHLPPRPRKKRHGTATSPFESFSC